MFIRFMLVMSIAILSGCANFNSIGRSSSLGGIDNTKNVAIHLDAQQRVVLSKKDMDKVCSEPNPDAMAAYAAALGLGVQMPRFGGGSLAQGGSSSISDIGLRTQSITLMRDVLYRICEASMNDQITKNHVPTLLGRGMDLTAVVLATEQLTGAVVASQSALVGKANASASASGSEMLRANEQALTVAETEAQEKQDQLTKAENDLKTQDTKVENAQTQVTVLTEQNAAKPDDKEIEANLKKAKEDLKSAQDEQKKLREKVDVAKSDLKNANQLVANIKETREGILRQMSTSASIETGGDKEIKPHSTVKSLHDNSKENIAAVATAVKEMVTEALNKDYSTEACLSFLGNEFHELEIAQANLNQQNVKIDSAKERIASLAITLPMIAVGDMAEKIKRKLHLAETELEIETKKQQEFQKQVNDYSKKIDVSSNNLKATVEMKNLCLKALTDKIQKRHELDLEKLRNVRVLLEIEKLEREIEKVKLEKESKRTN